MEGKNLVIEKKGKTCIVQINRPKVLNALNEETMNELRVLFLELRHEEDVGGVIVTGVGDRAFVAGADISEIAAYGADGAKGYSHRGQHVFSLVESLGKPVIAAVNGFALGGGCELALACTMRVASEKAIFGLPETTLGLIPGFGGTQRLARIVGRGYAAEMMITAKKVPADEALRIGLVNRVVPPDELIPACEEILAQVYKVGPIAVRYALDALNHGLDMSLTEGSAYEANLFGLAFSTEDKKEGVSAFLEKRKPEFRGK
jgi:enoyl-CoA hydratase/carnithine racemase